MIKCLVVGILIILSIPSFAQTSEPFCGTDAIYQNNPVLKQELINKTLALRNAKAGAVDPNTVFTIPVVFIVYHLGEAVGTGSNVSDANINTTLQYINQAFRAQGSFTSGTDVKIQFQLAKYDNQCTASSGIIRVNASGIPNYSSGFSSTDVAMQNQLRALTPTWSENNCIIIRLVYNMTDYGGYSYFWNDMFVESIYANGNISASLLFTHELGHSFSLYHTFEGDNNGANCPPNSDPDNQGDYISDTQPHKINDNCAFQSTTDINSCTGVAFGTVLLNHMSYSNSCKDRFTPKQIERMRNGLMGLRPNWVNSQALTGQSNIPTPIASGAAVCGPSSVTLSATGCNGTYNWYSTSSGGNSLGAASSYTTPLISTTTTYYVSCTISNCISARASAVATINNLPPAPIIAPVSINSGQTATLTVSNCNNGTVKWYNVNTGGSVLFIGNPYGGLVPTTTTSYYASCTVSGCESTRGSGTITVNVCNISEPITTGSSRCGAGSVLLSAFNCGGTYNWYLASSGGNSLGTASSYTTPSISTTTTYYVSCTVGNCTSTRASVVATIGNIPSAPTIAPITINSGQTATLTASNCAGTVKWYDAATGGNVLSTGSTSYTTPVLTTTTTYYASCTVGGCESATRGSGVVNVSIGTCPVPTGMQWANKTTQSFQPYWQGIAGYSYVIRYRVVGTSTWTEKSPIPCTVNGTLSIPLTFLTSGTFYEWQVKTICSVGNESAYSASTISSTNVVAKPCPVSLTHSTAPLPAGAYQASQNIVSQADVSENAKYTAGQSVLLQPGFKVNGIQPFTVSIEGCPTQNPILKMTGITDVTINGQIYVKYDLSILNVGAFPNSLFIALPNLPACDANTNSSRSWVVVYDVIAGQPVMTYCTLNSLTNVSSFSLTFLKSTTPRPFAFYIEIWDRLLNIRYVSGVAYIV